MKRISLRKELVSLSLPIFIEMLLVQVMGAADTFMLSQYSDDAVAAVGMVNQLVMFAFLFFAIINTGTTVLCSQYLGAGRRDKMVQVTGLALLLNIILGTIISLGLYHGAPALLGMMGMRDDLLQYGLPYMKIVGAFAFFQAIHLTISASLRADHKAIYPMMVVVIVNITNIVGNYMLIFGHWGAPALGVEGAAIATATSRGVAMIILLFILFTRHIPKFPLSLFRPFPWRQVKLLLKVGLPSAGENMSYNAQQVVLTYFINMIGNEALTARTYVLNAVMFVYLFCICISQGGAISIGHLVGERKFNAAFITGGFVLKLAIIITVSMSIIWALGGEFIFNLLTENPAVIALGCTILWYDILVEFGKAVNIYSTTVLRATGDVYFPFYLGVIMQWGVGVFFGWLFGLQFGWGLIGMWCAMILDENIRGFVFIHRWRSKKWMTKSFL